MLRCIKFLVSKDMRMSVNKFSANRISYVLHAKSTIFFSYLGMEDNLKQDISKLFSNFFNIVFRNCVTCLISLFY